MRAVLLVISIFILAYWFRGKDYHQSGGGNMVSTRNDVPDAAYQSLLMQNHRLRVQLYLERKGISTINPPHAMLVYIADSFRLGFLPDQIAEHCETMLPIWEKEDEEKRHATRKAPRLSLVQPNQ